MGLALLQRPLFLPKSCPGRTRVGRVRNTQCHYPSYCNVESFPTHPRTRPDPGRTNDVLRLRRLSACAAMPLFFLAHTCCRKVWSFVLSPKLVTQLVELLGRAQKPIFFLRRHMGQASRCTNASRQRLKNIDAHGVTNCLFK